MLLVVMKTYASLSHHTIDFRLRASVLQKIIRKIIRIVTVTICVKVIQQQRMQELDKMRVHFTHYPYCLYATDVKFQQG